MRNKLRWVILAICIVLPATGFAAEGSLQRDEAAEVSGLTGKDLVGFKANMDEVRVYDKQMFGAKDVSAEEAQRMTTKELITQTNKLDLIILSVLYDNPNIGIYRASRCSNSMAELLGRKDFTAAFLQAYSSFDPNPKTNSHFKDQGGLFATDWMLVLQNYPSLQNQTAGHEKEILSALCKKCREMQKVNASYPKGQAPYGPIPFALGPAQRFAKKVFPNARILSVHSDKDIELGIQELERLCSS